MKFMRSFIQIQWYFVVAGYSSCLKQVDVYTIINLFCQVRGVLMLLVLGGRKEDVEFAIRCLLINKLTNTQRQ